MTSRVGRGAGGLRDVPAALLCTCVWGQSSQDPWGFQSRPALSLGWGLPIDGGLRQDKAPASSLSSGGPRPVQDPLGLRGLSYVQRRDTLTHVRTPVWGNNTQSFEMCLPCVASPWGWDRENGRKWAPT